jgi:hypothetical protein
VIDFPLPGHCFKRRAPQDCGPSTGTAVETGTSLFQLALEETRMLPAEPASSAGGPRRLRSQSVILEPGRYTKYRPSVFTEQGVAMLSSVLRSERAVKVNIEIMRAFVRMRGILAAHRELAERLAELEIRMGEHDEAIQSVVSAIRQLMEPPDEEQRERIGFRRRTNSESGRGGRKSAR